jgi:hypothetical protein
MSSLMIGDSDSGEGIGAIRIIPALQIKHVFLHRSTRGLAEIHQLSTHFRIQRGSRTLYFVAIIAR